jgi:transcriptional regulator of acetoin/glycerol metabolism
MSHLPSDIVEAVPHITPTGLADFGPLEDMERAMIVETLKKCKGNRSLAARRLGIGRSSLWRKMRKYGLEDITS